MDEKSYLLYESNEVCLNWWAHDLNDEYLYQTIRRKSLKSVFWRCPKCETMFEKTVYSMVAPYGPTCPNCEAKCAEDRRKTLELYAKTPVSEISDLLLAWDDERDPETTMVIPDSPTHSNTDKVFRFKCANGHHTWMSPHTYLERGCPYCNSKQKTNPGKGYILDEWPELAAEWDSDKNGKFTPDTIRHNSTRIIAWRCLACGHEWSESPKDRTRTYSACCPKCGKILGSLGWKHPVIAQEWDPENELSMWQVRKQTAFIPSWICSNDPNHKWNTNIINRINGANCPFCTDSSKSRVELMYYEAAKRNFATVESGVTISKPQFSHLWTVDILITVDEKSIVVEYDGAHWHSKKIAQDTKKSLELLSAGFLVFRLREVGLTPLEITNPKYREIIVNPLSPKTDRIMAQIKACIYAN